ncbi:MAG: transposase, partial [Lentimicrobiaceae bacterium]|nr:transposase [Lentimicrobiaceae bacterium]
HWYKNHLSDYQTDKEQKKWCSEHIKLVDKSTGAVTEKPLYVCKAENIGSDMSIDDKAIGHDGFTILSNNETGKIALMVESCKAEYVEQALKHFGTDLNKIQHISMDMSATYALVFNHLVPKAAQIVDKFHVMKYVYQTVCDVRSKTVKSLQSQLSKGKKRTPQDKQLLLQIEQLRRVSHAVTQSKDKWSKETEEIMNPLFKTNNELKMAYEISQKFKQWYNYQNRLTPIEQLVKNLENWYEEAVVLDEFKSVVKMIRKHQSQIINFFKNGMTNAKAERLNGKIERFVSANYGLKDKDFFLYRTANYFS